ncbi:MULTISPECIES: hypothetical protein [Streptomyces]|uniref:hypothetical protein n=1 Tax=Streptomyces TaxID=1883 RepID=UPI001142BBFE|nr:MULTISPECIES: hypothetical protein [Streptomyces]QPK45538.1 hypothetical protein H4W23_13480 [Streptomyces gardneri]WRK36881.1 hypothetical protein U0M97_13545 [Streptomyces venezuelae]
MFNFGRLNYWPLNFSVSSTQRTGRARPPDPHPEAAPFTDVGQVSRNLADRRRTRKAPHGLRHVTSVLKVSCPTRTAFRFSPDRRDAFQLWLKHPGNVL